MPTKTRKKRKTSINKEDQPADDDSTVLVVNSLTQNSEGKFIPYFGSSKKLKLDTTPLQEDTLLINEQQEEEMYIATNNSSEKNDIIPIKSVTDHSVDIKNTLPPSLTLSPSPSHSNDKETSYSYSKEQDDSINQLQQQQQETEEKTRNDKDDINQITNTTINNNNNDNKESLLPTIPTTPLSLKVDDDTCISPLNTCNIEDIHYINKEPPSQLIEQDTVMSVNKMNTTQQNLSSPVNERNIQQSDHCEDQQKLPSPNNVHVHTPNNVHVHTPIDNVNVHTPTDVHVHMSPHVSTILPPVLPLPLTHVPPVKGEVASQTLNDSLSGSNIIHNNEVIYIQENDIENICMDFSDDVVMTMQHKPHPLPYKDDMIIETKLGEEIAAVPSISPCKTDNGVHYKSFHSTPKRDHSKITNNDLSKDINKSDNIQLSDSTVVLQGLVHEISKLNQYIQTCKRELETARRQRTAWLKQRNWRNR